MRTPPQITNWRDLTNWAIWPWRELLLPAACPLCLTATEPSAGITAEYCDACREELISVEPRCRRCGNHLSPGHSLADERCDLCRDMRLRWEGVIALGDHAGLLQQAIIAAKSAKGATVAAATAQLLATKVAETDWLKNVDLVIPTPIYWLRRIRRGFNPAERLGSEIAKRLNVKFCPHALKITRMMRKQSDLRITARRANVRGGFRVRTPHLLPGATVLLVDDVMTSGATAAEITSKMLKSGAARVIVAVAARAPRGETGN
ncbi:ComF family protein [Blastopirellula marina]|uniref:ComF family protein n=1 Tax=Blastopirellula marina TaxID=124 RepID=A0A2S8FT71_9BACT|nr:phosphoribosyltransferase family protein [Blastopirellula marina]PQO35382.1 hypothetical protein C5Y98_13535 [Blastopirellula marina]